MSTIKKWLRKNRLMNDLMNELSIIKIWKRNYKAKPLIEKLASEYELLLKTRTDNKKCVFFVGVPMHKNMGDQAQKYCIEKWIGENYPDYQLLEFPTWPFYNNHFKTSFEKCVMTDDIFVIQSGYCTTSSHFDHYMHRYIVKKFSNPVLIMPQTVLFNRKSDPGKTARIYAAHKKLLFLARDEKSYEDAKKYFKGTVVRKFPDIVTTLIGDENFQSRKSREGILICVRNDGEKKYADSEVLEIRQHFSSMGVTCDISDTNSDLPLEELQRNFESELIKTLAYFGKHKVVITDRYHGTIFSMISNTPVIVLATLDHKVKSGTDWFRNVYDGSFYNADSIQEAILIADKLLQNKVSVQNSAYFKNEYYGHLKELFERI